MFNRAWPRWQAWGLREEIQLKRSGEEQKRKHMLQLPDALISPEYECVCVCVCVGGGGAGLLNVMIPLLLPV